MICEKKIAYEIPNESIICAPVFNLFDEFSLILFGFFGRRNRGGNGPQVERDRPLCINGYSHTSLPVSGPCFLIQIIVNMIDKIEGKN